MVKLLLRLCGIERMSRDAILMDHLPIPTADLVNFDGAPESPVARRLKKLAAARERLGKPFKCAARNQDREVLVAPGVVATVCAGLVALRSPNGSGQHDHGHQIAHGVVAIESRRRR